VTAAKPEWSIVAYFRPSWWRNLTVSSRFTYRLFRDGFHALAVLSSGHLVAIVPGAIVTLLPGETEFRVSHEISRGTRPLHLCTSPDGRIFWGEYFHNPDRDEVHIYTSRDRGVTWDVAYTFPKGAIRHVHNIVYDEWEHCLWVLTGDNDSECRIVRASLDFRSVDVILSGNQQARSVALLPDREALYFASDTPLEQNYIYRMGRSGRVIAATKIDSSSISACRVGNSMFFSTMAEPSSVNSMAAVKIYRSSDGAHWHEFLQWQKDFLSMRSFQYGCAFLPAGSNTSGRLAVSTIAVAGADLETSLWRI
jgi:hypothetical protein